MERLCQMDELPRRFQTHHVLALVLQQSQQVTTTTADVENRGPAHHRSDEVTQIAISEVIGLVPESAVVFQQDIVGSLTHPY